MISATSMPLQSVGEEMDTDDEMDTNGFEIGQEVLARGLAPAGHRDWFRATVTAIRDKYPPIVVKFHSTVDGNPLGLLLPQPRVSYNTALDVKASLCATSRY